MKTPYGSEAEFIVHETLLDICEMAWFASKRASARSNDLQLTVNLLEASPREGPRFTIQLKTGGQSIQSTLTLTQAWRVDTFLPFAYQVTRALKLDARSPKAPGDPNA